jgi:hypothetical protein
MSNLTLAELKHLYYVHSEQAKQYERDYKNKLTDQLYIENNAITNSNIGQIAKKLFELNGCKKEEFYYESITDSKMFVTDDWSQKTHVYYMNKAINLVNKTGLSEEILLTVLSSLDQYCID